MKKEILKDLSELLGACDLEKKVNLKIQVSHLLQSVSFGFEDQQEINAKNKIISDLQDYVDVSDETHKAQVARHLTLLQTLIVE